MYPMTRTKNLTRFFLLCAVALITACTAEPFKAKDISSVTWGGEFELTAHTGKRVQLSDFRGQAVVLFFGFTRCPDICAPTLARLAQAMKLLGASAARVQVLFITVDPGHDTPAQLAGFVPSFHPSFLGLTGTPAELTAVARDYHVAAERDAGQPERVSHSGFILIKDPNGKLRLLLDNTATADDLAHDLRLLLK